MYSDEVLKRFKEPKFAGELKDADAVGERGNVKCGDIMRIYINVKENKITDIKFKTYGCVAAIVSSDFLCQLARGKTLEQAQKITAKDVLDEMGSEIPPIKLHCSILAQTALKAAIEQYKNGAKND